MSLILQIDGGGIRGICPAVVLDYIEDHGRNLNECDLYSGTSVGSIICALLAAGVKAKMIRVMLENEGSTLFEEKGFIEKLRDPNKAKYRRQPLYDRINTELCRAGVVYMKDLKRNLAITAFGLYAKKTHYICSWDPMYANLKVVDVVAWSALSAANYFGKIVVPDFKWTKRFQMLGPYEVTGEVFQDGGQGIHNSTCMDALITAIGLGLKDIQLLSLGCGSQWMMSDRFSDVANDGWFQQVKNYVLEQARGEATCDQVESADYFMRKHGWNFSRLDPIIDKNLDVLDGKSFTKEYVAIADKLKATTPRWVIP